MRHRSIILVLGLAWSVVPMSGSANPVPPSEAGRDPEKIANIRKITHVISGKQLKDMTDAIWRSMETSFAKQFPGKTFPRAAVQSIFDEADFEQILEMMVEPYDRHFTAQEVRDLLAFYESPTGRKVMEKLPAIMADVMPAITEWATRLSARAQERITVAMREEATAPKPGKKASR